MLTVNTDGCGFIDGIEFARRRVVQSEAGFVGAAVTLAPAGSGTAESLFANAPTTTLPARIASVQTDGDNIHVKGDYTDGRLTVPFSRRMVTDRKGNAISITEEADAGE